MARRYRIVFLGLTESEPQFMTGMSSRFGVTRRTVKHILKHAPMVLKKHLTLGEAREYADALQRAGGKVHIQEHGESEEPERERACAEIRPFGDFTVCPECGFTQLKAESCAKCGVVLLPEKNKEVCT
jgi:hypothetical protein